MVWAYQIILTEYRASFIGFRTPSWQDAEFIEPIALVPNTQSKSKIREILLNDTMVLYVKKLLHYYNFIIQPKFSSLQLERLISINGLKRFQVQVLC